MFTPRSVGTGSSLENATASMCERQATCLAQCKRSSANIRGGADFWGVIGGDGGRSTCAEIQSFESPCVVQVGVLCESEPRRCSSFRRRGFFLKGMSFRPTGTVFISFTSHHQTGKEHQSTGLRNGDNETLSRHAGMAQGQT